ncbi:MAG: hypothetical protein F6K16_36045 [Symploca sp. SIO2B6]|nr:hypothetical protein [Symploca sp. SIO2B6]
MLTDLVLKDARFCVIYHIHSTLLKRFNKGLSKTLGRSDRSSYGNSPGMLAQFDSQQFQI